MFKISKYGDRRFNLQNLDGVNSAKLHKIKYSLKITDYTVAKGAFCNWLLNDVPYIQKQDFLEKHRKLISGNVAEFKRSVGVLCTCTLQ